MRIDDCEDEDNVDEKTEMVQPSLSRIGVLVRLLCLSQNLLIYFLNYPSNSAKKKFDCKF